MQHGSQPASVQLPHCLTRSIIAWCPSFSAPQPVCSPCEPVLITSAYAQAGTHVAARLAWVGSTRKQLTKQGCAGQARLRWQEGVYDAFVEAMVAAVKKLKMGGGMDSSTTLGPLISTGAVERVGPWQPCSVCRLDPSAWVLAALEPPGRTLHCTIFPSLSKAGCCCWRGVPDH